MQVLYMSGSFMSRFFSFCRIESQLWASGVIIHDFKRDKGPLGDAVAVTLVLLVSCGQFQNS